MGSIVPPTVKSVIKFIMNSETYFKALFLVSGLVFIAGVLSICAGMLIVKDDQLLMEKVDALKDELKSNYNVEISNTSDGYYSIFNKRWLAKLDSCDDWCWGCDLRYQSSGLHRSSQKDHLP